MQIAILVFFMNPEKFSFQISPPKRPPKIILGARFGEFLLQKKGQLVVVFGFCYIGCIGKGI